MSDSVNENEKFLREKSADIQAMARSHSTDT